MSENEDAPSISMDVTLQLEQLRDSPEQFRKLFDEKVFPVLYPLMRKMAANQLRRERDAKTLQPTVIVHEAYVRLIGAKPDWQNREHFLACAANVMRHVLVEYARRRLSAKRGSGAVRDYATRDLAAEPGMSIEDILDVNGALAKLKEIDPFKAELIHLRFFGGLTIAEAARVKGVSLTTAKDHLRTAQAWMNRELAGGRTKPQS